MRLDYKYRYEHATSQISPTTVFSASRSFSHSASLRSQPGVHAIKFDHINSYSAFVVSSPEDKFLSRPSSLQQNTHTWLINTSVALPSLLALAVLYAWQSGITSFDRKRNIGCECGSLWEDSSYLQTHREAQQRQSQHITAAAQLLHNSKCSEAHHELVKAMSSNRLALTHIPKLLISQSDCLALYKLHVEHLGFGGRVMSKGSAYPSSKELANMSSLLQLQDLLGMTPEDAEKVELSVFGNIHHSVDV
ncbi:hypothetical protein CEUSTIGMA_g12338.t1 [Chlamydomonas eustigma]|uniref:Uncharacterized protein n=1 Tax=Chlamydomonas eustigma TaxID=1157962 RepID=A0A250XPB7_9CHLO|nr:hypothetical protein CEUSTIGMA_g12338.t1 [Chlamydomonas eustigma]|eukprot:GAX84917.1 hypothetical protein CEUSTIGMA_g12338.t1 [Chlamydomonas eustigma]